MKERIQKVLGNAGVASRRSIEQMVLDGRVAVNGKVIRALPILVDVEKDKIVVDGESIRVAGKRAGRDAEGQARLYFILNKPRGVYSTNVAQGTQLRAIDLLPPDLPARLYPVGRLEAEAKGLLLLTNDGELTNQLTHPRYGVAKTYRAIIDGSISPADIAELEEGIWLPDHATGRGKKTGRSEIEVVKRLADRTVIDITTRESRNRELRRILARMGHKVRDMTRIRLGPLELKNMKPGQFRPLTPGEIKALRRAVGEEKSR